MNEGNLRAKVGAAAWLRGIFTAWQDSGMPGDLSLAVGRHGVYVTWKHLGVRTTCAAKFREIAGTPYALGIEAFKSRGDWRREP